MSAAGPLLPWLLPVGTEATPEDKPLSAAIGGLGSVGEKATSRLDNFVLLDMFVTLHPARSEGHRGVNSNSGLYHE
jgi:hypothetical protein